MAGFSFAILNCSNNIGRLCRLPMTTCSPAECIDSQDNLSVTGKLVKRLAVLSLLLAPLDFSKVGKVGRQRDGNV